MSCNYRWHCTMCNYPIERGWIKVWHKIMYRSQNDWNVMNKFGINNENDLWLLPGAKPYAQSLRCENQKLMTNSRLFNALYHILCLFTLIIFFFRCFVCWVRFCGCVLFVNDRNKFIATFLASAFHFTCWDPIRWSETCKWHKVRIRRTKFWFYKTKNKSKCLQLRTPNKMR